MSMQANRRRPHGPGHAGKTLVLAALTATSIGVVATGCSSSVELAWKLEPGTDLLYRMSVQSETEAPLGMGSSTMNMEATQRWSVLDVDGDGNATVSLTTERVRMSIGGPMGAMTVDSADGTGSGSPLGAVAALAGTSYSVVLDPRGRLVEISGVEQAQAALRARIPDPSAHAMLDQMLSEEALRSQWGQGMFALPAEPVGVGSTWENAFTMAMPPMGSMTVATSLEVESLEGDVVVVSSSGTMSLSEDAGASSPIPVTFGDATMVGSGRFDTGRGLLLDTEGTVALQMSVAMGGRETTSDVVSTVALALIEE